MCFDYTMVSNRYGINLDTETDSDSKDPAAMTDKELEEAGLDYLPL